MEAPKVYDQQGQERNWQWLVANFGPVSLERAEAPAGPGKVFRVVKLQDREGPAVLIVHISDEQGNPHEGARVVRYWPDAPSLPNWPQPTSRWRARGVFGKTNPKGEIGYGMGTGDYYWPPSGGASAVWVAEEDGASDCISGLGMLGGTNHRHLEVHFQLQTVEGEPSPPEPPAPTPTEPTPPTHHPTDDNWARLFEQLDRIEARLKDISET